MNRRRNPGRIPAGPMLVLGLMSGTSADAIDAALARISGAPPHLNARLEQFTSFAWPAAVRSEILRVAGGAATTAGQLSRLNFLMGEHFARAALRACRRFGISPRRIALIGSHGQTVFHQGRAGRAPAASHPAPLQRHVACTMQLGEPAVIAARTGVPTVGDFRPADMAAGGQGAPLVPFVDYLLFRHPRRGRAALNIGGIANVTVIPPAAQPGDVFAFDTGPGNMLADALAASMTDGRLRFDRNAKLARAGALLPDLLAELLRDPYYRMRPPKSCGREQFGAAEVEKILRWGRAGQSRPEDLLHTATLLTAATISDALRRFVLPRAPVHDLIVSGGGARNPLLMRELEARLAPLAIGLLRSSDFGVPEDAKEAFAFAVLAYETFHGRPANLPGATGARPPARLGKICFPPE
jgi:anhydro-N-acetylmuramic acid kinase